MNFTFCLFKSTYLLPNQAAGTDIVSCAVPDPGSQGPGVVLKSRDFFLVTRRRSVWDLSYPPGKEWWLTSWSGFESETWALVWIFPSSLNRPWCDGRGGGWVVPFCLQLLLFDANELPVYSQHSRPSLALEICLNTCGVTWIYLHPLGWCPSYRVEILFSTEEMAGSVTTALWSRTTPCYTRASCWIGGLTLCSYGRQHLQVLPGGSSDLGGIFRSLRRDCI